MKSRQVRELLRVFVRNSTNIESVDCATSESREVSSDETKFENWALWLNGGGDENKMLNGPNMILVTWILDIVFGAIESRECNRKMDTATMLCLKQTIFNHKTLELLITQCTVVSGDMPRLLPLLSRFLRIFAVNASGGHPFIEGSFDVQLFSTLAQAASQRYSKEQLTMVGPSTGGVPIFSLYCQQLLELMLNIKSASRHMFNDTNDGEGKSRESRPKNKNYDDQMESQHLKGLIVALVVIMRAVSQKMEGQCDYENFINIIKSKAGSGVRSLLCALKRRMQWCGLDLGDSLAICLELQDLNDTLVTLWLTRFTCHNWKGEGIQRDLSRVGE